MVKYGNIDCSVMRISTETLTVYQIWLDCCDLFQCYFHYIFGQKLGENYINVLISRCDGHHWFPLANTDFKKGEHSFKKECYVGHNGMSYWRFFFFTMIKRCPHCRPNKFGTKSQSSPIKLTFLEWVCAMLAEIKEFHSIIGTILHVANVFAIKQI